MAESCINEAERESAKVYERLQGCERQIDGLTAMMTSQSEQITIKEEVIKYLQREKQRTQRAWLRNEIRYKTAMRAMLVQDVVSAARARQSRLWYQSVVRRSLTAETLSGAEQDDMAPFGQMLSQGDVGLTDIALHDSGTALLKCVAGLQESSPKRVSRE
jgi:small-conductance mechanosensitive channel